MDDSGDQRLGDGCAVVKQTIPTNCMVTYLFKLILKFYIIK